MIDSPVELQAWPVVRDSVEDAHHALAHGRIIYIALALVAVLDGFVMARWAANDVTTNGFPITEFCGAVAFFITLGVAMRDLFPQFRLTVRVGMTALLLLLGWAAVCVAGSALFIIPGIYFGIRLCLMPFIALFNTIDRFDGRDPITQSWALTARYFWPTMWFSLWQILIVVIPLFAIDYACIEIASHHVRAAYALAPLMFYLGLYANQSINLMFVRWVAALRNAQPQLRALPPPD